MVARLRKFGVAAGIGFVLISQPVLGQQAGKPLASKADYAKYIDPLVGTTDFGTVYSDDGAADGSVVWPTNNKPVPSVLAILQLGQKSLPLLIDCLGDDRVTSAIFLTGERLKERQAVPVSFVCLDILLGTTDGRMTDIKSCPGDDGLGACVKADYYFRPDDFKLPCLPYRAELENNYCVNRPWVRVVQRNWRRAYLRGQLKFKDPYASSAK